MLVVASVATVEEARHLQEARVLEAQGQDGRAGEGARDLHDEEGDHQRGPEAHPCGVGHQGRLGEEAEHEADRQRSCERGLRWGPRVRASKPSPAMK